MEVAIIGVGQTPCKERQRGKDFREMMYEAAKKCLMDADISADEIQAVVASGLEFFDGVSITDSFTPDQVGGRMKFNTLIANDSLTALIHGSMLVETGMHDIVLVEAHAKPSDILNYEEVLLNSLDPHYLRPLSFHPYVIAGLDASAYLSSAKGKKEDLSLVVSKNRRNALKNPNAAFGEKLSLEDVEATEVLFDPLKRGHVARRSDYAATVILASKEVSKRHTKPVWIRGFGYCSFSSSCSPEVRRWGEAEWAAEAFRMALSMSKLRPRDIDLAEVSDPFSYMELEVLDALGILKGVAPSHLRKGDLERDGFLPTNPSGGCMGMGFPLTAAGLQRVAECADQLRGEAEGRQVKGAVTALAASPDSEISDSGSVVLLSSEGR